MDVGLRKEFEIEGEANLLFEIKNFLFAKRIIGYYRNSALDYF